jgi:hypothetical protein
MKQAIYLSLTIAIVSLQCGCTALTNDKPMKNPFKRLLQTESETESDIQPNVNKMAVIWKDTTYSGGAKSVRGFGGRVFFYDEHNEPVKADGEFVVYGFDDSENPEQGNKADRKYVFEREKLEQHFSESEMGPSYSFWIPWEKTGGERKTITLIPVFKTHDGRVVKSGQSIQTLPGKEPKRKGFSEQRTDSKLKSFKVLGSSPALIDSDSAAIQQVGDSGVVQASFNESSETASTQSDSRTTTFMLPSSMSDRISATRRQLQSQLEEPVAQLPEATVAKRQPVANSPVQAVPVPHRTGKQWNSTSSDPADLMERWRNQIPRTSRKSMMTQEREQVASPTLSIKAETPAPAAAAPPSVDRIYGQPGAFN